MLHSLNSWEGESHNQNVILNNMAHLELLNPIYWGHCNKNDDYIVFLKATESYTIFCGDCILFLCSRSYLVNPWVKLHSSAQWTLPVALLKVTVKTQEHVQHRSVNKNFWCLKDSCCCDFSEDFCILSLVFICSSFLLCLLHNSCLRTLAHVVVVVNEVFCSLGITAVLRDK